MGTRRRDENGKLIPVEVKVSDWVLFGKGSGNEVKIDGVEYLIMKESDIMGYWSRLRPRRRPRDCALEILALRTP